MTNKTIDISEIPVTERLTIARKLAAGENPEFGGRVVVNNGNANTKAQALADSPPAYRLAMARKLAATQKPEYAPVGAGGELLFDDAGEILGFCSFN